MAKIKLPFELQRPDQNTPVANASEIDATINNVTKKLDALLTELNTALGNKVNTIILPEVGAKYVLTSTGWEAADVLKLIETQTWTDDKVLLIGDTDDENTISIVRARDEIRLVPESGKVVIEPNHGAAKLEMYKADGSTLEVLAAITQIQTDLSGKGTYSKPSNGIPSTDLTSDVQTSLRKADSAVQPVESPEEDSQYVMKNGEWNKLKSGGSGDVEELKKDVEAVSSFTGVNNQWSEYSSEKSYKKNDLFIKTSMDGKKIVYRVTTGFANKQFSKVVSLEYVVETSLYLELMRQNETSNYESVAVYVRIYKEGTGYSIAQGKSVTLSYNNSVQDTQTVNSNGMVYFEVPKGKLYTITAQQITIDEEVIPAVSKTFSAVYATRNVNLTYYTTAAEIEKDGDTPIVYIQKDEDGKVDWTCVTINQDTASPTAMCSINGSNDDGDAGIKWIRENAHNYLVKYQGNNEDGEASVVTSQLKDDNRNYYADGTVANLTGAEGDVMMKLPEFYYYCANGQKSTVKIYISRTPIISTDIAKKVGHWEGNQLIGCYESRLTTSDGSTHITVGTTTAANSFGRSVCNINSSWKSTATLYNNKNIYAADSNYSNTLDFVAKAMHNRGLGTNGESGYCAITWEQQCVMAMLYLASYPSNVNCQTIIGAGANTPERILGGTTNTLGMNDTTASNVGSAGNSDSTATKNTNFFGVENWWNGKTEFIGNCRFDDSAKTTLKVLSPFVDKPSSYTTPVRSVVGTQINGSYPRYLVWGNYLDILNNSSTVATDSTGYCDYQSINNGNNGWPRAVYRSSFSAAAYGGAFYVNSDSAVSGADAYVGVRLAFIGDIREAASVAAFKAASDATF